PHPLQVAVRVAHALVDHRLAQLAHLPAPRHRWIVSIAKYMTDLEAVALALHADAIHLLRGVRRADDALGIGPARLSALSVLLSGPKTLGELAAAEQVKAPTITRVVAGLESLGLAARRPHPTDGRSAL